MGLAGAKQMIRKITVESPILLNSEDIRHWLGGIVPAWTLLDRDSFAALHRPPSAGRSAIRLAIDLSREEAALSIMARNALVVLGAAAKPPGLKLTSTGNLSRHVVAAMFDQLDWPGLERDVIRELHKVINEPDFHALYFVRNLLEAARLVRKHKGHLVITPTGRKVLDGSVLPALQAILFETAFWRIDLGYFSRGFLGNWPQDNIGLVLWSLGVSAGTWIEPARLVRLSTIPVEGVLRHSYDIAQYALEGAVLRQLEAFGLFERREDPIPEQRFGTRTFYRKTPFFDRFLTFNVRLVADGGIRH
jgi:hypothetical protein